MDDFVKDEIIIDPPKGSEPIVLEKDATDSQDAASWYALCRAYYVSNGEDIQKAKAAVRGVVKRRKDLRRRFRQTWFEASLRETMAAVKTTVDRAEVRKIRREKEEEYGAWEPPHDGAAGLSAERGQRVFEALSLPYIDVKLGVTTLSQLEAGAKRGESRLETARNNVRLLHAFISEMHAKGAGEDSTIEQTLTAHRAWELLKFYNFKY